MCIKQNKKANAKVAGIVGCVWLHKYTRKLGKYTRNGGEGRDYLFIFCRPPHAVPLEMLMKSDKLQNYIPREMLFFLPSPAHTKVLTLANEGLCGRGVGGSTARTKMRIPI